MEIHLVSSLTPDDERRLAPAMLAAIGRVLDRLPVTYSVRLETANGNAIQHSRTAPPAKSDPDAVFEEGATASAPFDQQSSAHAPLTILDRD